MDQASSISAGALKTFVHRCGIVAGLSPEDASRLVDGVVEADLRGVASHGVSRLPTYLRALAGGVVNPSPAVQVLRSKGAVEVLDADNGLGVIVGQQAMERAVNLAGEFGVGTVSVRNSNHSGMLAAHVLKAPPHGAVGFFTSNGPAIMAPFGGREPRLGNGPVAYAIPRRQSEPLVLDMACSATNRGRIRLLAEAGETLPPGWALDETGLPTQDASAALRGVVLPAGGHRGSGLAVVNEVLAAALPGASLAVDMPRAFLQEGARVLDSWQCGHLAMAFDIDAFTDMTSFLDEVERLCTALKDCPPVEGTSEVLLPGEIESRTKAARLREGVPLSAAVIARLDEIADELSADRLDR